MKKIQSLIFILFFIVSCSGSRNLSLKQVKSRPLNKIESHQVSLNKKFTDRINSAPQLIIQSLNKMDSTDNYESYNVTPQEKALFIKYYKLLPAKFKEILESKVAAVYFIKNFTGGGMTDCVFDRDGEMYIALYLNPALLNTTLENWINFRDGSSFTDGNNNVMIKSYCGSGHPALIHTLVHEASHIYDFYYHVTPYIAYYLVKPGDKMTTDFISNVWKDYQKPVDSADFTGRGNLSSYGLGKKLDISHSKVMYRDLNKTPFSSLYGSSSWVEDFAETFTWYYLNRNFNIQYKVVVTDNDGGVIFSPAEHRLVTDRYKFFEDLAD